MNVNRKEGIKGLDGKTREKGRESMIRRAREGREE